jgi:8-oxo-dGTP diphosphatase
VEKRRRIGAYGVARDNEGRVLLVRSSDLSNTPGIWYLPGGGIDHGEDPRHAVVREFAEETGLAIEVGPLRDVFSDLVEFPHRDVLLHHDRVIFDVTVVGGELTDETDGTSEAAVWVAPEELSGLHLIPFASRVLGVADLTAPPVERPAAGVDDSGETDLRGRSAARADLHASAGKIKRFGAYGLVTDPAGRILLARIAANYPGAGRWHLPGGGIDFGEQPAEGLIREIHEESGQRGDVGGLLDVSFFHNPQAVGPERTPLDWYSVRVLYRVSVSDPTVPTVIEGAGGSTAESRWFSTDEVADLPLTDLTTGALRHLSRP